MALKRDVTYSGRFNAASPEHPQGEFKNRTSPTSEDGSYLEQQWLNDWDGFMSSLLSENDIVPNGLVDEVGASQYFEGILRLREVSPRNNDWNGYLDPEHQSSLPAPNGYPGASGGGEVYYAADEEISFGIFAGSGGATVSSDSDGWIFTGSIYKLFDYTTEQLADIDVTKVPVYLKDQVGAESFLKHNGSSVIVTKVGSQLKVEIAAAIFAESFTKLWRFFVTERVGRVVELSAVEVIKRTVGYDEILPPGSYTTGTYSYPNGRTEKDYTKIVLIGGYGTSVYNSAELPEAIINTPWIALRSHTTDARYAGIIRVTDTLFAVHVGGVDVVRMIIGYLK